MYIERYNQQIAKYSWEKKKCYVKIFDIFIVLQVYIKTNENRETSETNLCIYQNLIYDKLSRRIQWGKERTYNRWCWDNWFLKIYVYIYTFRSQLNTAYKSMFSQD